MLTLLILISWLVNNGTMLEAPQVKHPHTAIRTTTDKDIDTVGAESNIIHLLVVGDQLGLCCQSRNIPNGAGRINAGSYD